MLSRTNRLSKQKDFEKIFRQGKEYRVDGLTIKSLARQQSFSRFGLVISTKVAKKAVARNRLRRQIRAILRAHLTDIKPGFDVVLIAKPSLLDLSYQELEETIVDLFKKAKLHV